MNYSLQNTIRHALLRPTSREAKYKAKAAISEENDFYVIRAKRERQELGAPVAGAVVLCAHDAFGLQPFVS